MAKHPAEADQPTAPTDVDGSTGKGHATPSRREQETARKRPLVPNDRKAASKESRAKMAAERDRARVGMANGEERYLPARDKGPQRRFTRDWMDARYMVGELTYPVVFLMFIATFVLPTGWSPYVTITVLAFMCLVVIDDWFVTRAIRKQLVAALQGRDAVRGLGWYVFTRGIQFRAMRSPRAKVKRGEFPTP